ncbi:MAG: hypothetical protein QG591_1948, partial [Planctomycetota bacterium]|nr:hypothetical protein [Planctomycetota bacterium]
LKLCSQTGVWEQAVVVYLKEIFQAAKMLQKIKRLRGCEVKLLDFPSSFFSSAGLLSR